MSQSLLICVNRIDYGYKKIINVPFSPLWKKMDNHRYHLYYSNIVKENLTTGEEQKLSRNTEEETLLKTAEKFEETHLSNYAYYIEITH
jgi:hypothetical protein